MINHYRKYDIEGDLKLINTGCKECAGNLQTIPLADLATFTKSVTDGVFNRQPGKVLSQECFKRTFGQSYQNDILVLSKELENGQTYVSTTGVVSVGVHTNVYASPSLSMV